MICILFYLGGNSEPLTGLTSSMEGYPYFWHSEAAIYDYINGWLPGTQYGGLPRQNGTMTQIR
jgi:hypothetical protein